MTPKFPEITVTLVGEDGNAFAVLGRVSRELRHGGVSEEERKQFMDEAMSGDYNHLLQTVQEWVTIE